MEQDLDVWKRWMSARAAADGEGAAVDDTDAVKLTEEDRSVVREEVGPELARLRHWFALPGDMHGDKKPSLPVAGEGVIHPPHDSLLSVEEASKAGLREWLASKAAAV